MNREAHVEITQQAVLDVANAFHLRARDLNGGVLAVPCGYQIQKYGQEPFRASKASPQELQDRLDTLLAQNGVILADEEALAEEVQNYGLGIDCSSFAFRCLSEVHKKLGLPSYSDYVFRDTAEIRRLTISKASWKAALNEKHRKRLEMPEPVSATWLAEVFGKEAIFIVGSTQITAPNAVRPIHPTEVLPGDLLGFEKIGADAVSRLAVVESVEPTNVGLISIDFWHPSSPAGLRPGLRKDTLTTDGVSLDWARPALADQRKYQRQSFYRPIGMAAIVVDK